jgi:menaquinone-dependent protoporphyrinogen IX oxidase
MNRVLIVYDTVSGSTAEMGEIISTELKKKYSVEIKPVAEVASIASYDAVVIGSPMRFGGFVKKLKKFIERYESELARKKVVYFFSILYIVKIAEEATPELIPYVDPTLAIKTISKKKASGMDKTHSLGYYDRTIVKCGYSIKPLSIAYLKGRLVLNTLPILTRILMKIIMLFTTKEQEGDFLNPASVKEWAAGLSDHKL